ETYHFERIVPLYTVPEDFPERLLRTLIGRALFQEKMTVRDILPESLRKEKGWENRAWALSRIHFPATLLEKERAREILAFEEFLILETALGKLRQMVKRRSKNHRYTLLKHLLTPFREHLGFEFTTSQKH